MNETTQSGTNEASKPRITVIIQNRFLLDSRKVTGRAIKKVASIPAGFSLHRRVSGANEAIEDDALVEVNDGDHFYAQPMRQADLGTGTIGEGRIRA